MKNHKSFKSALFVGLIFACLQTAALGQTASQSTDAKVANVRAEGMGVRFESAIPYASATLTISGPDGTVYRREFEGGSPPSFALFDKTGAALGGGQYTYELRYTTVQMRDFKERLMAAQDDGGGGVADENGRTNRGRLSVQSVVQSGSFAVQNGTLYVGNETEPTLRRDLPIKSLDSPIKSLDSPIKSPDSPGKSIDKNSDKNPQERSPGVPSGNLTNKLSGNLTNRLRNHRAALLPMFDQVIPDDLIVQGSACIGFDCVNNESFGFDTIRMKENSTRIKFEDTSVAPFPTTDWQLTANDSASGGANRFSIEDITAATVPFTITGSAPSNSIFVDSSGRVGLRTATPALDLHFNTSNTPATRLEQNNSGGFTAQTWDVAGNEANFFVRDVTGGSRLPFRIRPGAPTSSIDINASGNVGIGTANPVFSGNSASFSAKFLSVDGGTAKFSEIGAGGSNSAINAVLGTFAFFNSSITATEKRNAVILGANSGATNSGKMQFFTANAGLLGERMRIDNLGRVGIGSGLPDQLLSVNGEASKPTGGSWLVFSDERLKNIKGNFNSGLKAVMQLRPIRYELKQDNSLGLKPNGEQVGFGAQALQKIIPEAVTRNENGYLQVNNDPILWTMLNAIKEQQKEIAELKSEVRKLRAASHRRRK